MTMLARISPETPDEAVRAAAEALLGVHRSGLLTDLPPLSTRAQAYAVQDLVLGAGTGTAVGGWKVAPAGPGEEPRCAPIAAWRFLPSGAKLFPIRAASLDAEVEIALEIGRDLPPRARPYTAGDIEASVAAARPAIEILGSRFVDRRAVPQLAALADGQSAAAVVVGAPRADWRELDFGAVAMTARAEGLALQRCEGGPDRAAVLRAVAWLADHAASRRGGLRAGEIVITGARIKPFLVRPGLGVAADVDGLGRVEIAPGLIDIHGKDTA